MPEIKRPEPKKPGRYLRPGPDIMAFIGMAKPHLKAAGVTLNIAESSWLRPEGAKPQDYRTRKEGGPRDPRQRIQQYRGGWLAEMVMGQLRVWLQVVGPNDNDLSFEIRDSLGSLTEALNKIGPDTLDKMFARLRNIWEIKLRDVQGMKKAFHLS